MKNLNRLLVLILALVIATTAFAGCSSESAPASEDTTSANTDASTPAETASAPEAFEGIEPLAEPLPLTIGILSGAPHGFTNVLIERLGGYEYANVDITFEIFGNGPVLVEAMVSGAVDAGIYGVGGVHSGTITHGIVNLAPTAPDFDGLKVFARNDSEIVAAGMDEETGVYGTAEMWEGKEIFAPVGTTLYYTLAKGLDRLGLSLDDVQVTHMEPPNTNTALRAGQAEIGGLWGTLSYGDILEEFTPVISAGDVGVNLITQFVSTEEVLADSTKTEAIQKWMELYYAAAEWMFANDENFDQTVAWFQEWQIENGINSTIEELDIMCSVSGPFTLDQAYEIVASDSPIDGMSNFVYFSYDPLEFYVSLGNFTEADLETFAQPQYYDTSMIEAIYANQG